MKKSKLIILVAVLLATVLLLSSCALDWDDVFLTVTANTKASYQGAEKLTDLLGAEPQDRCGELVYFTAPTHAGKPKHIVYNMLLGRVVYFGVDTETVSITVTLELVGENPLILERATTTPAQTDGGYTTITLYKANGVSVVSTPNTEAAFEVACDLVYLDGKYYRVDNQGGVSFAFDYAPGAARPQIFATNDRYYYAQSENAYTVYTRDSMRLVSYFTFPSYAENTNFMILSNGNILSQYMIVESDTAEKYSVIFEGKKVTLVTQIFDVADGESETIEADYVLKSGTSAAVSGREWEKNGMDGEELENFATVWMIDGTRLNTEESLLQMVSLNKKGEIEDVLTIEGQNVRSIEMVGETRWILHTVLGMAYLVDQEGEILGEVSNAELHENRFFVSGKIYDLSMQVLYDYGKDSATLLKKMNNSVLLKNSQGDIVCLVSGQLLTVVKADDEKLDYCGAENGYYIVRDASDPAAVKYDVYNDVGTKILSLRDATDPQFVAAGENATLICAYNADNIKVYYRLS